MSNLSRAIQCWPVLGCRLIHRAGAGRLLTLTLMLSIAVLGGGVLGAVAAHPMAAAAQSACRPILGDGTSVQGEAPAGSAGAENAGCGLSGRVMGPDGVGLPGVIVSAAALQAVTHGDGGFTLLGVAPGAAIQVDAPGYARLRTAAKVGAPLALTLTPIPIKAIYDNIPTLADVSETNHLVDLIDQTELNAMVIDIKDGTISYDSQVQFFRDAGSVQPVIDMRAFIARLKAKGIYTIGRIVVFKDPLVAETYPKLAVKDATTGGLWRDTAGNAWVNGLNQQLWQPNIDLALEARSLGFDEIQWDYVRFPTDGDLSNADFGQTLDGAARQTAITAFVAKGRDQLHPTGVKIAADLFGFTGYRLDDDYIGQNFDLLYPLLDWICLMIYPSHFPYDTITSAPGSPNDHPFETITESLQVTERTHPGSLAKVRPWLQAFTYPGMSAYGAPEMKLQIDAAEARQPNGWMFFDWNSAYTGSAAFRPAAAGG